MTDNNKENITSKSNSEANELSSKVKMPLVDALRSFFNIPEAIEGETATHR